MSKVAVFIAFWGIYNLNKSVIFSSGRVVSGFLLVFTALLFSFSAPSFAEKSFGSLISPGELSWLHESVDGITNCTKCHSIRGGIQNDSCLDCHKDIGKRISANKGYHATVSKDKCISCHSDHKGRKFTLIEWKEKDFDHKKSGYILLGKHKTTDCKKCHTIKTKKNQTSYLGLDTKCLSCHEKHDIHKGTLGKKCESCHTEKNWKDLKFKHDSTKYQLLGKHMKVTCEKCHSQKGNKKGIYKVEDYSTCNASGCHDTKARGGLVHGNKFKDQKCADCHTVDGWKSTKFNHNAPSYKGYKLTGKHARVKCDKCHKRDPVTKVPHFKPINYETCSGKGCHDTKSRGNIHGTQFKSKKCDDCHTVKGWKPTTFNHSSKKYAGYKLEGKHTEVKCLNCHKPQRGTKTVVYKPINSSSCNVKGCHDSASKSGKAHGKQFKGQKCEDCHTVKGWKPSVFNHNSPTYGGYKLTGKHKEAKCEKCHTKGKDRKVVYKPIKTDTCNGSGCHDTKARGGTVHGSQFKDKKCASCHITADWKKLLFEHNKQSKYKLEGKHAKAKCDKCHKKGKYKPLKSECIDCHRKDDKHKGSLGANCKECHDSFAWAPKGNFHNLTGFPLEGLHTQQGCKDCHKEPGIFGGLNGTDCTSCHIDPHFNQLGTTCDDCHSALDWTPTKFKHGMTTFRLEGQHRVAECQSCHLNREYRLAERDCVDCHNADSTRGGSFVYSASNVVHSSSANTNCQDCHKTYNSTPADYQHSAWSFSGAHNSLRTSLSCTSCHSGGSPTWALTKGSATASTTSTDCEQCHAANFAPAAGANANAAIGHGNSTSASACVNCHLESYATWQQALSGHSSVLSGQHEASVKSGSCTSCHLTGSVALIGGATTINDCASCHSASFSSATSNAGVAHTGKTSASDCAASGCHTASDATFGAASYTHGSWTFAGAHTASATACTNCHVASDATQIKSPYNQSGGGASSAISANTDCQLCHKTQYDVAAGNSATAHSTFAGNTPCTSCHFASHTLWSQGVFSHTIMTFTGAHASLKSSCSTCHEAGSNNIKAIRGGTGGATSNVTDMTSTTNADCYFCHVSDWNKEGPSDHPTGQWGRCLECHNTSTFDR